LCILGRRLILQFACHLTGCTAQWHLLHTAVSPKFFLKRTIKNITPICLLQSDHVSYAMRLTISSWGMQSQQLTSITIII